MFQNWIKIYSWIVLVQRWKALRLKSRIVETINSVKNCLNRIQVATVLLEKQRYEFGSMMFLCVFFRARKYCKNRLYNF